MSGGDHADQDDDHGIMLCCGDWVAEGHQTRLGLDMLEMKMAMEMQVGGIEEA